MIDKEAPWWRGATLYQIYPRSFKDSNGDGLGDLAGITAKLDYIATLGVDGIWISPFFPSPMRDFGYDVTDHSDVDPRFGTLADFDALVHRAHELGLKVIIDQVWSHTSSDHPWFLQSRLGRDVPRADWYVWADARPDGSPPNNWQAWFGGPAWTWDPQRGQYWFHNFMPEMPDLNFHCAEVQDALLDVARFWLDRGVDGFRLDTANFYFHSAALLDNPPRPGGGISPVEMQLHLHNICQPENLNFLARLRTLMNGYGQGEQARMTVAEISSEHDLERMVEYTRGGAHLHTAYSFLLLRKRPDAAALAAILSPWQTIGCDAWPAWALSNHDTPRVASRWAGPEGPTPVRSRQGLLLLACLRGTVFLYQGEELGLTQADIPYELVQDPAGRRGWPRHRGRDGCRTPLPWAAEAPHAGFSTADPWLPVPSEHLPSAVDRQEAAHGSLLQFAREVFQWRRQSAALRLGDLEVLRAERELLLLRRSAGDESVLAVFNLGDAPGTLEDVPAATQRFSVGDVRWADGRLHLGAGAAWVAMP